MESIQFRSNLSRKVLLRMIIIAALSAALLVWKLDFINDVYFRDQLTATGLIINGSILALFVLGIVKIIWILLAYGKEERNMKRFVENLEDNANPL
ncbi:MAG: hypothetical protein ABW120_11240, partial [Sedimenticola sp.]